MGIGAVKRLLFPALFLATPALPADIVVDVETREIVQGEDMDVLRRPASIVKLMTAYIAFAALETGDIDEDTDVTISADAAKQPPVKLRLRKDSKHPFGELLNAAIVGSKNDAAFAVAEAVAGSEADFIALMNDAAEALGMVNTRYETVTGLPSFDQFTSARDTAILTLALLGEYPERSGIFASRSITFDGRTISTTNPLFGRVDGTRGLKTGFTCTAGYSIAALTEREGRKIVSISLGNRTKAARLKAIKELIESGYAKQPTGQILGPGDIVFGNPPSIGACDRPPGDNIAVARKAEPKKSDAYVPPPRNAPSARSAQQVARLAPRPILPPPPPPLSGWGVSLGAFDTERDAQSTLRAVNRLATRERNLPKKVVPRPRDGRALGILYALNAQQAQALCVYAKAAGQYCITLSPDTLLNPRARWRR